MSDIIHVKLPDTDYESPHKVEDVRKALADYDAKQAEPTVLLRDFIKQAEPEKPMKEQLIAEGWTPPQQNEFNMSEPKKVDDPTMEQWERVIAVEQPCEFWDFTYDSMIRPLSKVFDGIFRDTEGCKWQHCRPIIQQGHTHAWWPEIGKEKPQELPDDALVVLRTHCWHANTIRRVKHVDSWIDVTSFYWPHDLGR